MEENNEAIVPNTETQTDKEFEVTENRTFTQDEVNNIIKNRLGTMRKSASKSAETEYNTKLAELEAREQKLNALEELKKNDLPDELASILVGDQQDLGQSVEVLKKYFKKENTQPTGFVQVGAGGQGDDTPPYDSIKKAMGM